MQTTKTIRTLLYGAEAPGLRVEVEKHPSLSLVEVDPDVIISYGGDGTLLAAEQKWPGIPKVPIRNSRRGHRCIPHPAPDVIERLVKDELARTEFMKLVCIVQSARGESQTLTAMNEINVHMGHINSAVRFKFWYNGVAFENGLEIIGDGFVVSTPFGSTAYFNQITRGLFFSGIGAAFKYTAQHTNHLVMPEDTNIRISITRGPAVLACDNVPDFRELREGDELHIRKHVQPAMILTWEPIASPSDTF